MKRRIRAASLLAVLLAAFPNPSMAKTNAIELRWEELSAVAVGKDIDIRMPDGARLQGELLVVRVDALSIDVRKTSNKRTYPKGQLDVPRTSVSTFEMQRLKTVRWRVVGTTAGVFGGLFTAAGLLSLCYDNGCSSGAGWGILAAGIGVGILGNRMGHEADMQRTVVKIIP